MNYKGYELTVTKVGRKWDGKAVCEASKHSPLVTMLHPSPEAAEKSLKWCVDYWTRPLIDVSPEELLTIVRREEVEDAES